MKKTLRAIVAALLAAIMALGCTSAFAAESDEKLFWNYYDWEYYYDYAGEMNLGENSFASPDGSYNCYYIFNADKEGYYTLGFTNYNEPTWIGIPESVEDGTAYNEAEYIYSENNNGIKRLTFKLNEGETIIGFDFDEEITNETFEIVYEGDKIESVSIDNKLLLNRDIYNHEEFCEIYADTNITFSSGSVIKTDYIEGTISKDVDKGQNTVSVCLLDETFELTVDVYLITDVVESVEITNIEDYLNAKINYDGYDAYYPINETFTFTMTDGSTQSFVYSDYEQNSITLPDGTETYVYLTTENIDGEIILNVMIADAVIKSYNYNTNKASANENFSILAGNIKYFTDKISYYLRHSVIAVLECDSFDEYLEQGAINSALYFSYSINYFTDIFREIYLFLSFLL